MEKVLKGQLPISKKVLILRIFNIQERIDKCEEGIPSKFWCDNCKRLTKKIESLKTKMKDIELKISQSQVHSLQEEALKVGNYLGDGGFSPSTPTFKYICSSCGYTCVNKEHLWPPLGIYLDSNKKLQCCICDGPINEIGVDPPTKYICIKCEKVYNSTSEFWITTKHEYTCPCGGKIKEIKTQ